VASLFNRRSVRCVTREGWQRINAEEQARGAKVGKPREKIVDVDEMLRVAGV
jgi:adrenodoxin-NADP+ reductase